MDLSKHAFFEGKIVPLSEANINIATHGFLYGTAVFGGVRGYWNEEKQRLFVFRPYDHFRRLLHSARMMAMHTAYDVESLIQLTLDVLRTDDWQAIASAYGAEPEPLGGQPAAREFARLEQRIVNLLPRRLKPR